MGRSDIPDAVQRFIAAHIDSVSLLDVLLLLRAAPEKDWTAEETARALVSTDAITERHLAQLVEHSLATGGASSGYRFAPTDADVVDALADCFARRRHTVIALIYGSDVRQATALSDAFKLRRRKN